MSEDWAAVALAIDERMAELGLTQLELVKRSLVSNTMVREIRRNIAQRRRSSRTMESLSVALEWHPQHLIAILNGRPIPAVGEPVARSDDDVHSRLLAIEYRLDQLLDRLTEITDIRREVTDIGRRVEQALLSKTED